MRSGTNNFLRRLIWQVVFIVAIYAVLTPLIAFDVIGSYVSNVLTTASIYVIVALGLNLVTGMTGQLVLGNAGFMAVGAYMSAILLEQGIPMLPSLVLASCFTALVGLLIGVLSFRLRGDYLAIVTLGFGEIIRVVLMNIDDLLGFKLTGGATGLQGIPGFMLGTGSPALDKFLWVSMFMVLAILALVHLLTSSHGRAILSVRDDEIASESMGVNTYYTKLYAFVFSTLLAGLAGGLFASHYNYLNPNMFDFLKSMDFLIIVVFGGLGSLTGTVVASFVLILIQDWVLRIIPTIDFTVGDLRVNIALKDFRLVLYPLLLILMMIFRPQGLLGTKELPLHGTLLSRKWWKETWTERQTKWAALRASTKKRLSGTRKGV